VPSGAHAGLDLVKEGMAVYFRKHPAGKALHDVIAAVAALSPSVGKWVPVVPYRERGEWGCLPAEGSSERPVQIMTALDVAAFESALAV
jgi:hypothetical protein